MRYRELFEDAALVKITPAFLKQVRTQANRIASDIADDLPADLTEMVTRLLRQIDGVSRIGQLMTVFRAELRPESEIMNISTTGVHWTWHADSAQVYHHDNAYDDAERGGHDRNKLVAITLEADVPFQSIDWPYTVGTNLIHPNEKEITIFSDRQINILGIYTPDSEIPFERTVRTYGHYP